MKGFVNIIKKTRLIVVLIIGTLALSCNDELSNEVTIYDEFNVSVELAKKVALSFAEDEESIVDYYDNLNRLNARVSNTTVPVKGFEGKSIDKVIIIPDKKNAPAMYVVTFTPTGYIIVSATKKESPILGFSPTSTFDFNNLPIGLAEWIVGRMDKIQVLKYSKNVKIPLNVKKEWAQRFPTDDEEVVVSGGAEHNQVGPLLQTLWSQGNGYNNATP